MSTYFKTLELGTIAAGGSAEETWTPERDIIIRKVIVNERTGASVNAVKIYIEIAGQTYTKQFVPASVIGTNVEYCWKPDLKIPKGAEIYIKAENAGSSSVTLDVVFEYE